MYQLSPDTPGTAPETRDANVGLDFEAQLKATKPNVPVTWLVVGLNVAVFVAMVVGGTSILSPSVTSLLSWGANYGPATWGAQPWRLLSHGFVHVGIIHLGFNMFALMKIGPVVERIFGSRSFAVLYLTSGIGGGLLSAIIHQAQVSAGASGALFGVYGGLGAFLWRQRGVVSPLDLKRIFRTTLGVIVGNFVMGLQVTGIDNGAHLGGLIAGAVYGLLLSKGVDPLKQTSANIARLTQLLGATFAIAALMHLLIPTPINVLRQTDAYTRSEAAAIEKSNDVLQKLDAGTISDQEGADRIDHDVLPAWREAMMHVSNASLWPSPQSKLGGLLVDYVSANESWWTELAHALRAGDSAAVNAATRHRDHANTLQKQIARWEP